MMAFEGTGHDRHLGRDEIERVALGRTESAGSRVSGCFGSHRLYDTHIYSCMTQVVWKGPRVHASPDLNGKASTPTDGYRWVALSNTTLGVFMASLDASIVLIALPAIFRGINLDPLQPSNIGYLLWMLMGYLVVTAVLVVTFGRLCDMFGRVRMYNAGFAVFTGASVALSLTPGHGSSAAMWLIGWRIVQGIGGALLMANSTAILTDAFPATERGRAMGINMVAGISGSFIGLIAGGLLAD